MSDRKPIVVAMSGGVDSSTAAALLNERTAPKAHRDGAVGTYR